VIQDQKNTAGMGISRDDSYKIYYPNDQIWITTEVKRGDVMKIGNEPKQIVLKVIRR
jgi:hypothetical protein